MTTNQPPFMQAGSNVANNAILPSGFPAKNLPPVLETLKPLQFSSELVCTTAQPVYLLPRDHKFHAGGFYACNEFCVSRHRILSQRRHQK